MSTIEQIKYEGMREELTAELTEDIDSEYSGRADSKGKNSYKSSKVL